MGKHIVYISIGSNIGDKLDNCKQAIESIAQSEDNNLIKSSKFYKTQPVDYKDQDWFVNSVIMIETLLDPLDLLLFLKAIEHKKGRVQHFERFGPRIIDLDILLYDDLCFNSSEIEIPHPRMHKRCFVLEPLCDIDPFIVHPVLKKNVKTLLKNINDVDQKVILY